MDVNEASGVILNNSLHDYGNFYGGKQEQLPLGVGQLYNNIRFPLLNIDDGVYDTVEGLVYVLTHECDIDRNNSRPFNDSAVIVYVIPLESCIEQLASLPEQQFRGFIENLAKDNVNRVSFFPAIDCFLPNGGVIYLNQLAHTHVSFFDNAERVQTLTSNGLRIIDYKITNHLLRPKSVALPLSRF